MDKDTIRIALKKAIYQRRSTRSYTDEQVPEELIEEIIDAGRYAPSAKNEQTTRFFVIANAEKLTELRAVMTNAYANMEEEEGMQRRWIQMIRTAKSGQTVDNTYGATALIVTANKKDSVNAIADCTCALSNMMLTASAAGLGNCWINQFFSFRDVPSIREYFESLGLADDEVVCGALALGYADDLQAEPLPRTGNTVTYFR